MRSQDASIVSVHSGWNCVPTTRPPRTSCGPLSVRASTSKPSGTLNTSSCHSTHGPATKSPGAPASGSTSYQPISYRSVRVTSPPRAWAIT